MCRCQRWEKNPGLATELELPENRDKLRRKQSGTHSDDGDKSPAVRDSCREISRRPPQSASEGVPADCGKRNFHRVLSLPAASTSPWLERWFARGNTRPTWQKPPIQRAAQTGIARHRTARTSERTRCRSKAWTRRQGSRSVMDWREQFRPCLYLSGPHGGD